MRAVADDRAFVTEMLATAGIGIDGGQVDDLRVRDERFFRRFLRDGSLGLGESYMDAWWDCEQTDALMCKLYRAKLQEHFKYNPSFVYHKARAHLSNLGTRSKARESIRQHYDVGNHVYEAMLDERLVYTCAVWDDASTLDEAQVAKMELICRKLGLKPGMHVLDIGCGWGSFLKYAAERHGVTGVGVSISEEQVRLGRELCAGLPIEIRLQDYRDLREPFDRIVTVGMFEHVGHKNHRAFMDVVHRCLAVDGLYLLHTIGRSRTTARGNNLWISKYIFPNTTVPSAAHLGLAIDGLFHVEDWESFGHNYDRTLMAWHANFQSGWPLLSERHDDRFRRMWDFYLLTCAGAFRARALDLWQVVLSREGTTSGYRRPERHR